MRPVAESVAKMLPGRGREDNRHFFTLWWWDNHRNIFSHYIKCGHFWELQIKVLKKIQILRPVAESVAKMLRGRGREDGRHTQVLLDILMRTDSSSNWGCIWRASPRHANTYLLLLLYEMSLVVYLKMNHLWNFVFWMFKLDYERTSVSQNQTIWYTSRLTWWNAVSEKKNIVFNFSYMFLNPNIFFQYEF